MHRSEIEYVYDTSIEDFDIFTHNHKKDNYDKAEIVFGKENLDLWKKQGLIYESSPGTLSLLK